MTLLQVLPAFFIIFVSWVHTALALGTACTSFLGPGTAPPDAPYWLQNIPKRGTSAFNTHPYTYPVFRNVKDYGAMGDGITDDTVAINQAVSYGDRCGQGCDSSTLTPAIVYFPKGIYRISSPIIAWYYTSFVGDARHPPTLLAAPDVKEGTSVIDADPYIPDGWGAQWYQNQNNFFRSVRNFVIDLREVDPSKEVSGLHWQVSQATSLTNVVVEMSRAPGNKQRGIFMENGSGGFMSDLIFRGGRCGILVGNQQFAVRNITVEYAGTGICAIWNWGWTFQNLYIKNCNVGVEITTGGVAQGKQTVGSEIFLDAEVTDTPIFILTSAASRSSLDGSVVIENVKLRNVPVAVQEAGNGPGNHVVLVGGDRIIAYWMQGNIVDESTGKSRYVQGEITPPHKAPSLLDSEGKMFGRTRPQYADYAVDQFVSVKAYGAMGDGKTDDTIVINQVFEKFAGCKIIFFDAGTYLVTSTINIPDGTKVVGEMWSEVMGTGFEFSDPSNPIPVVQAGTPCTQGELEISDMIFSTRGPTPGAIVLQWNAADSLGQQGTVGAWDMHIRLAASLGSDLGETKCSKFEEDKQHCQAAFMGLHITASATAYLEGTWIWLGDHDLDNNHGQITVFSGRGVLSESAGPVWLLGTEHHTIYQYNFAGARDHYIGLMQTETPYYQPRPASPKPFYVEPRWKDPMIKSEMAFGVVIQNSQNICIYGAGLYSFFRDYDQSCLQHACQEQILVIDKASSVSVINLSTIGAEYMLSIGGEGVVPWNDHINGYASTLTRWKSGPPKKELYHQFTEYVVLSTAGYNFP